MTLASASCVGMIVLRGIGLVALDIDAQRRAARAGAGQPEDDARVAAEQDLHALVLADRAVDRIDVGEILRALDAMPAEALCPASEREARPQRAPSGRPASAESISS